ncbi:MAG: hypothetical protein GY855_00975 [candidate division Zixibacteria bacterium]|nr:hypothetical protein [candidate division Zixibacteria bacterium]
MRNRKMFYLPMLISLIIAFVFIQESSAKTKWRSVKPNGKPEYLRYGTEADKYRYYKISQGNTVKVTVYGPTTLKIATRLGMDQGEGAEVQYGVNVFNKGMLVRDYVTKTSNLNKTFLNSNIYSGKKRHFQIKVPKGKHLYEFRVQNSETRDIYIRLYKDLRKKKVKRVQIQPFKYKEVMNTVVSEKLSKYYLADKNNPIELQIIGPTTIQGYSRLNFTKDMKGKAKYSFAIYQDNELLDEYAGSASKSSYYYKNKTEVVPSVADKFQIKVPSGKHKYTIKVYNGSPAGISFRFLMPENDLKNKE